MSVNRKSLLDYGFKSQKDKNESAPGQQQVFKTSNQVVIPSEILLPSDTNTSDIGNYLGMAVEESKKYTLLTSPWIPVEHFMFTRTGKRNLKFQHHWLRRYYLQLMLHLSLNNCTTFIDMNGLFIRKQKEQVRCANIVFFFPMNMPEKGLINN